MGGRIKVDSKPDHGTTFTVVLKTQCRANNLAGDSDAEVAQCKQPPRQMSNRAFSVTGKAKLRVLLANDEQFLLMGYKKILETKF